MGAGISKLRNQTNTGKAIEGKFNKFFELISGGLRSVGFKNKNQFLIDNARKGAVDRDLNIVSGFRDVMDDTTLDIARKYSKVVGDKIAVPARQKQILEEMTQ